MIDKHHINTAPTKMKISLKCGKYYRDSSLQCVCKINKRKVTEMHNNKTHLSLADHFPEKQ